MFVVVFPPTTKFSIDSNVTSEEWIVRGAALRGECARDAARARSAEELKVRRPERGEWTLEVAVRRAVHRQEKVREERLRRDQRVVPTHALGPERRLELPLDAVVVVARRRALRVAVAAAVMARVEEHVPKAAKRRERIIRPAVAFVVPAQINQ